MTLWRTVVLLATAVLATAPASSQNTAREEFTAFAVSIGGPRSAPGSGRVDIVIERWSSDSERDRMLTALREKGQDAMLEVLRDLRTVGTIQVDGQLGYDLRYAHQQRGEDGGRQIFLATDRPISVWEAINRPRTIDYPFTFIEMTVNDAGEGEGQLTVAARLTASDDGRFVHQENYTVTPVKLNRIRKR